MSLENKEENKDSIYINELTDKIANIIKSTNKNDFIKKYNDAHNQIKKVDEIMYTPSNLNPNTDIKSLFEMLKKYDNAIENSDMTVEEYKNMCNIVELLESKMKNMTFEVKEI